MQIMQLMSHVKHFLAHLRHESPFDAKISQNILAFGGKMAKNATNVPERTWPLGVGARFPGKKGNLRLEVSRFWSFVGGLSLNAQDSPGKRAISPRHLSLNGVATSGRARKKPSSLRYWALSVDFLIRLATNPRIAPRDWL